MNLKEPQLAFEFSHSNTDNLMIGTEFDAELANQLAEIESYNKHLYRPNTYLHKWWARRCGTTFRAILKDLVPNQSQRNFYSPGGLEGQIILDPMIGGGTTIHEAIRMGASVVGADIDPIPILQARATLTSVPVSILKNTFSRMISNLRRELGMYFQTTCPHCQLHCDLRFVLYAVRRVCECGNQMLLVDSLILRHNPDDSLVRIDSESFAIYDGESLISKPCSQPDIRLYEKNTGVCLCGRKPKDDLDIPYYQRYVPVAVAGECATHGFFFSSIQEMDLQMIRQADTRRSQLDLTCMDFAVLPGPKSTDLLRRSIHTYLDLFSSRQLLVFSAATRELGSLEPAQRLKFALLFSTATEFNSMLCGYKGAGKNRPGAIRHTFAQHGYSFPDTALENNPLASSRSSGTLQNLFESRLVRGTLWAKTPVERSLRAGKAVEVPIVGEIDSGEEVHVFAELIGQNRRYPLLQGSSIRLDLPDQCIDHIVTDPPYFDSVQYGDLAAFFRVWLRYWLPTEVQWSYDLNDTAVNQQLSENEQYEAVLTGIFSECYRVLKQPAGRLIFTFHHWNPKGWASLTNALKFAGFILHSRYVIHSENPSSVHIVNQNSLHHDVILVLGSHENRQLHTWPQPTKIDKADSYTFCKQCGGALGYLLNTPLTRDEMTQTWTELFSDSRESG